MKTNIIHWVLSLALSMIVGVAYSQETATQEVAEQDGAGQQQRPQMPGLFLTVEQRRILEACAKGFLMNRTLEKIDLCRGAKRGSVARRGYKT